MPSLLEKLKEELVKSEKKANVVLPESSDERILKAAALASKENICKAILIGSSEDIEDKAKGLGINVRPLQVIDPQTCGLLEKYVIKYCEARRISERVAYRLLKKPINFAAAMVRFGDADAMVAGAIYDTQEVIMSSELIIGLKEGVSVPSTFFIMDIPTYEKRFLVFADCALNPNPSPSELADIAISTADSIKTLLGWTPKVAMLSFSTKGSATHPLVEKVIKATEIAKRKRPDLLIDGELQADAAIVPEVAKRKIKGESQVAGDANILIFPDLNAGNISYKLVQWLTRGKAYGPILQGFARPVSDLSRGATVDDIIGTLIIISTMVVRGI